MAGHSEPTDVPLIAAGAGASGRSRNISGRPANRRELCAKTVPDMTREIVQEEGPIRAAQKCSLKLQVSTFKSQ
jgi:hypothetical protein